MTTPIRAVIFDLGGTLENVYYDDEFRLKATPGMRAILAKHDLDPGLSDEDLYHVIKTGMKTYGKWREETNLEKTPEQVFSEYVFTRLPRERVAAIGEELAFYWDNYFSTRTARPETSTAIAALHAHGFRLGVISNITSRCLVPYKLAEYGIQKYFEVVLCSCETGWRKPNPRIFREMTQRLKLDPSECAYVGDTISRDVIGAHRAGYRLAIQIKSFLTAHSDRTTDVEPPDAVVESLTQVLDVVKSPH